MSGVSRQEGYRLGHSQCPLHRGPDQGRVCPEYAGLKGYPGYLSFVLRLGVQSVKENDRFGLDVLPALNSMFGTLMDAKGNFHEVCSNCGDCVLDQTGCICPITRCPKGLLNGPCGGVMKGKCEVDRARDCAWILIYKELEKKGQLDKMKALSQAKDYGKAGKPHKVLVNV